MSTLDTMKKNVICVKASTTVEAAHAIMVRRGIRHLPVVDGRKLLGILSDRDLLITAGVEADGTLRYPDQVVADMMTRNPVTCRAADSLQHVAGLMLDHRIDCVPVTDDAGNLQGILTSVDMVAHVRGLQDAGTAHHAMNGVEHHVGEDGG